MEYEPQSGRMVLIHHQTSDELINQFREDTCNKFEGISQSNPNSGALYKGWWRPKEIKYNQEIDPQVYIDYSTVLFGLVKIFQTDEAISHFTQWKKIFENDLHQAMILVIFFPVNVIGDFF